MGRDVQDRLATVPDKVVIPPSGSAHFHKVRRLTSASPQNKTLFLIIHYDIVVCNRTLLVSLEGQDIFVSYRYPTFESVYSTQPSPSTVTVVDEEEFVVDTSIFDGGIELDFDASSIEVRFPNGGQFGVRDFNGFVFKDIGSSIPEIVGAEFGSLLGLPQGMSLSIEDNGDTVAWNATENPLVRPSVEAGATLKINLEFEPDLVEFDFAVKPDPEGEEGDIPKINSSSKGVTPFALLGGEDFDATQVDANSIRVFDSEILEDPIINGVGINAKKKGLHYSIEDINEDGIDDFVFKVSTVEFSEKIESLGETELFVHGQYGNAEEGFEAFVVGGATADIF